LGGQDTTTNVLNLSGWLIEWFPRVFGYPLEIAGAVCCGPNAAANAKPVEEIIC